MEKKTRILVVEDNPDDQELMRRMLQKARLTQQVEVTGDGKAALDYLISQEEHTEQLIAVFLDLNLPGIHGLDLLERIREDDRLCHLAVIVMTSSNSPSALKKCQQLGVSSFIQKPLSAASFSSAIAGIFHFTEDSGKTPHTYRSVE